MWPRRSTTTCRGDLVRNAANQLALFSADTRFVLVVTALFSSGLAAQLGTAATVVFLVLRSSANFHTGLVYLGQREISRQAGTSLPTTRKALATLEAKGLIQRRQPYANGRTIYTLTDQLAVFQRDEHGEKQPVGALAIPFVPHQASKHLDEARAALVRGVVPAGSPVTLNLTINLVQHTGSGSVTINNHSRQGDTQTLNLGSLDDNQRAFFARMLEAAEAGNAHKKPPS